MDLLYTILVVALIIVSVFLIIIGAYVVSILFMVKQVIRRVDSIAFNVLNIKSFTQMGKREIVGKLINIIRGRR